MRVQKVIRKRIRHEGEGVQVAGDVNAVVSANVGQRGSRSSVRSRQRIVQRAGKPKDEEPTRGTHERG